MVCEKNTANMERMEETIDLSDYRRYQHFLSNSTWSHHAVIREVQVQASSVLAVEKSRNGESVGIVIDESAHLKKGLMSVGVSRQYAGLIGKVDNCQVGVYASLCKGTHATLVAERLFLPESWTGDLQRCHRAGIPGEECIPRTKPQLALDIIDECVANGVAFDWVGGDGLYGHSGELTKGLDDRGLFFVLDVHRDQMAYLEEPPISVSPTGKGNPKTQRIPFRLDTYCAALLDQHWSKVKVRKTAIEDLKTHHYNVTVIYSGYIPRIGDGNFSRLESYLTDIPRSNKILLFTNFSNKSRRDGRPEVAFMSDEWKKLFVDWYGQMLHPLTNMGFSPKQIYWYPYDETKHEEVRDFVKFSAWAKEHVPQIQLVVTILTKNTLEAIAYTDIAQVHANLFPTTTIPRDKTEIWLYEVIPDAREQSPY